VTFNRLCFESFDALIMLIFDALVMLIFDALIMLMRQLIGTLRLRRRGYPNSALNNVRVLCLCSAATESRHNNDVLLSRVQRSQSRVYF